MPKNIPSLMAWDIFLLVSAEWVLYSPGYESDERCSLGLNILALPVADTARPFCVQRSVRNAAAPTARRTPGTANRAAQAIIGSNPWSTRRRSADGHPLKFPCLKMEHFVIVCARCGMRASLPWLIYRCYFLWLVTLLPLLFPWEPYSVHTDFVIDPACHRRKINC